MNKTVVFSALGIAIIGSVGAAPFLFGSQIEARINEQFQTIENEPLPAWISITKGEYEKGWRNSHFQSQVTFDLSRLKTADSPTDLPDSLTLTFDNTIEHGPFTSAGLSLGHVESNLIIPDEYAEIAQHYFGSQSPFTQKTNISFNGELTAEASIPAYKGPSHDGIANINWQGANGVFKGHSNSLAGQFTMDAPLLEIQEDDTTAKFSGITLDGDSSFSRQGLQLGTANMHIDEIAVNRTTPENVNIQTQLNKFKLTTSANQEGETIKFAQNLTFNSFKLNDDIAVGPGSFSSQIRNLNADTVATFQQRMQDVQKSISDPEQLGAAYALAFIELGPQLLASSPEFEIDNVFLTTDMGDISGSLLIGFNGEGDFQLNNPATLIPRLTLDFKASIPAQLSESLIGSQARTQVLAALQHQDQQLSPAEFEQAVANATQQQLMQLQMMGFIVQKDGQHSTHLHFADNKLTLNGAPADHLLGLLPIPTM